MSNLIHSLREALHAADWQAVGAVVLGLDLLLFAALAARWEEAGKRPLRIPRGPFHRGPKS